MFPFHGEVQRYGLSGFWERKATQPQEWTHCG